ncbi:hypothetical protein Pmani_000832 [Petrolisthes manimaculis]|uniref:Uncharacterized protein n=1 Tax=Petrolisthes manimaculis TaxID=1843537 RepID=A0AAE1UKW6_9EUCA|nr:hypothetical protein Pmani_000832 [Petrolisthes manimaculis]
MLPPEVFTHIRPTLTATWEGANYTALKEILSKALRSTRTMYLDQLDATQPEGHQPSALLKEMIRLNNAEIQPFPEYVLRHRHNCLMPTTVHIFLPSRPELSLT